MSYWYALQCISGKENTFRGLFDATFSHYKTFFPKRILEIRRGGEFKTEVTPLFAGYLFFMSKTRLIFQDALSIIRKMNAIHHSNPILKILGMHQDNNAMGNEEITPVHSNEMDILLSLTDQNELISFSSFLQDGDKVKIIHGPLKGFEGVIVKINARKKRVKIALDLLGQKQIIDLGACMVT